MRSARGQGSAGTERPSRDTRVYLFYGADESGSRALGARLLKDFGAEKHAFTGAALKADPGALAAEASAVSMFGGKSLLWVEPAGEDVLPAVELVLAAPAVDHPVALIGGALKKTSALLKAVQAHPLAVAQVSYVPDGRNAAQLVTELGRERGLRISPPVAAEVAARAGNDRAIVAQELTKFALFLSASPDEPRELTDEVLEILGADAVETDSVRIGDLALAGELTRLANELELVDVSGVEAIPTVRALQRRLIMLAGLRSRIDAGQKPDQVFKTVWNRDKQAAERILPRWSSERLALALEQVAALERTLLLGGAPDKAAVGEQLVSFARATRS